MHHRHHKPPEDRGTARVMGCTEIISEDLGDGQAYAGIRVLNPFR